MTTFRAAWLRLSYVKFSAGAIPFDDEAELLQAATAQRTERVRRNIEPASDLGVRWRGRVVEEVLKALGRIGDLINGEHLAARSSLPWAVKYLNPNSPQFGYFLNHPDPNHPLNPLDTYSVHPTAGGYELVGDRSSVSSACCDASSKFPAGSFRRHMAMYAIMRFFLSYFQIDEQEILKIPVPQLVSCLLVGSAIIVACWMRWPGPITPPEYAERVWGEEAEEGDVPEFTSSSQACHSRPDAHRFPSFASSARRVPPLRRG